MKKISLLVAFMIFILGATFGQTRVLTGTVTSAESGEAMPGVTVRVSGLPGGSITDAEGMFSIAFDKAEGTLIFSFIGMKTVEVRVTSPNTYNVVMEPDVFGLEEVVITALGIEREKKALGYSIGEVPPAELLRSNETNIVSALTGKVSGVSINTSSSQPGSAARITIRGNSSINYNNMPLFIVDGIPYDNSENTIKMTWYQGGGTNTGMDIDPNNIESLTVLKGASASALYGSRASNGVVLITTKKGISGKPTVNFSQKTSFDKMIPIPLQTTWAQGEFVDGKPTYFDGETRKTFFSWGPRIADVPGAVAYDKWEAFQTGTRFENSFNVSGGNGNTTYYAAYTDLNQQGMLEPIKYKRKNMLFNVNASVTKWLDASLSFSYTRTDADRLNEGLSRETSIMAPLLDAPWTWNPYPIFNEQGTMRLWSVASYNNPYWIIDNTLNSHYRNRYVPVFGLTFHIAEGLSLDTRAGIDSYTNTEDDFVNSGGTGGTATGRYNLQTDQYFHFNSDVILSYTKDIGKDFKLDAMIGQNVQSNKTEYMRINGRDFIIPDFKHMNNMQNKVTFSDYARRRSESAYGQLVIGYKDMLYYTFTGRNDWSSTLPLDDNSFFYSSNSIGFLFTELITSDVLSYGKIRAAYSEVGNDAPAYSVYTVYTPWNNSQAGGHGIQFPYRGVGTFFQSYTANNPALRNEMTKEVELGLEMKFFQNRLGFETSIYHKSSFDQILSAQISDATGFGAAMMNIGEIENKGIEALLYATPVQRKNFRWDITANWAANRSKVIKITDEITKMAIGGWGLALWEGHPYPVIELDYFLQDDKGNYLVWDDPTSSRHGYYIRADQYKGKERPSGKVEPNWRGGLRNTFQYKGWTLSAFLDMQFGGYLHNMNYQYLGNRGMSILTEDRTDTGEIIWEGVKARIDQTTGELIISGEPNDVSVSYLASVTNQGYQFNSMYKMQKSDYIKLREVSLSYDLPKELLAKIGFIKGLAFTVSGTNLWRKFDKSFSGSDPEHNLQGSRNAQGLSIYMFPTYKSINFGLNVSF